MPDWKKIAAEMSTILKGIVQDASSRRGVSERSSLLMQKRAGRQKQCLFWDCDTPLPSDHILCRPHWMSFQGDLIDECPGCNRAKDKQYELCLDCYDGRASQQYETSPDNANSSRSQQKQCHFWDCNAPIPINHFLCRIHFRGFQENLIDYCKGCNRAKDKQYELCLDCHNGHPPKQHINGRANFSYKWYKEERFSTGFFVYILKLDGGRFYAGQTRELRERLSEHRDGNTKSTAGKNPKLVWFATLPSRDAATSAEVELKKLIDSNPREIRRMVVNFQDLIRELEYS